MGPVGFPLVGQLKAGKVRAEWVPVKESESGDYVAQAVPTEYDDPGLSVDEARLYGILLGDGYISKGGKEFKVSCNPKTNQATIQFIKEFLEFHTESTIGRRQCAAGRWRTFTGRQASVLPTT